MTRAGEVLGVVFGFRRIEATNLTTLINHKILHANERRGVMVSVLQGGPDTNMLTGETYTPDFAKKEIENLTQQIKQLQPQVDSAKEQAHKAYKLRNQLTFWGFLMLLAAKVFSAYAVPAYDSVERDGPQLRSGLPPPATPAAPHVKR